MTNEDKKKIYKIDSLAKEAIRCAIGVQYGKTTGARAQEAIKEFQTAVGAEPSLIIDLIQEWLKTQPVESGQ